VLLRNYSIVVDRQARQQRLAVDLMMFDHAVLCLMVDNQVVVEDIVNKVVVEHFLVFRKRISII
jgi:hypothetical protein